MWVTMEVWGWIVYDISVKNWWCVVLSARPGQPLNRAKSAENTPRYGSQGWICITLQIGGLDGQKRLVYLDNGRCFSGDADHHNNIAATPIGGANTMTNTTLAQALTIALALTDEDKAQLTATLIALGTARIGVNSVPASAPAPAPKTRKPLEPAADVDLDITPIKAGRGKVAFMLGFGAGKAGAKLQVKDAGFVWDTSFADDTRHGAWVGTVAQAKKAGVDVSAKCVHVTAEYVQKGRDKAAAKAEKRAAKNA